MIPSSRDEFIDYVLRNLGAPVININVDSEQVDDRIDEALKYYQTYHHEAVEIFYMPHQITQENIDNGYIDVNPEVLSVNRIVDMGGGDNLSANWMSNLGSSYRNLKWDLSFGSGVQGCGGLSNYEFTMQHLKRIDNIFGSNSKNINFNYNNHHLNIFVDWNEEFAVDQFVVVECHRMINPETYGDVWGDTWLAEYATALVGRQWGVNLSKFAGIELPSGITLDGDKIYDRYHELYLGLREEMSLKWELPVDFIVG